MASHHEIRRRSSAADRTPFDNPLSPPIAMAMSTTFSPTPDSALVQVKDSDCSRHQQPSGTLKRDMSTDSMPPPPRPLAVESPPGRRVTHARALSMASAPRKANRLSLTLPIAPASRGSEPVSNPPPPSSAEQPPAPLSSKPPTPAPTPGLPSLEDAGDFIIAIAAQERKVLELREELARAEADLASLKRRWASKESMQRRAADIQSQALASSPQRCPTPDTVMSPSRHSVDVDRKKLWLQAQQNTPSTPTQGRRKVIRGGHARTLSLLSPVKSDAPFKLHEDKGTIDGGSGRPPSAGQNPALSKRATWQPRSQPQPMGMPQLVEDFKMGLRAFVEDLRQITVGDEPITGPATPRHSVTPLTTTPSASTRDGDATPTGHGRRRSASARSKANSTSDAVKQESKADDVNSVSKANGKGKQFSWEPLGLDALEDNDWTSWESPSSAKSSRWSGSTIHNGGGMDNVEVIQEKADESTTTPAKAKGGTWQDTGIRNTKLDELLPSMVNRLSPSNLKRTANNLMNEWEKSLVAPEDRDNKENSV